MLYGNLQERILGTLSNITYFLGPTYYLASNFHLKGYPNMHSIDQNIVRKIHFYFHKSPNFELALYTSLEIPASQAEHPFLVLAG